MGNDQRILELLVFPSFVQRAGQQILDFRTRLPLLGFHHLKGREHPKNERHRRRSCPVGVEVALKPQYPKRSQTSARQEHTEEKPCDLPLVLEPLVLVLPLAEHLFEDHRQNLGTVLRQNLRVRLGWLWVAHTLEYHTEMDGCLWSSFVVVSSGYALAGTAITIAGTAAAKCLFSF